MMENDASREDGCPYYWLNEWLCEYVDGTMDPSVRLVFEEYLDANPELADHVERLCRTRSMLCRCTDSGASSEDMRARLQERIREDAAEQASEDEEAFPIASSTRMTMAIASAMVVMLGVGMFVGATVFTPPAAQRLSATEGAATERTHEQRAPAQRALPRETPPRQRLADDRGSFQRAPYAAPPAGRTYTTTPASMYTIDDALRGTDLLRGVNATP